MQANLSTLVDPDGGWMVPVEMDKELGKLAIDAVATSEGLSEIPNEGL